MSCWQWFRFLEPGDYLYEACYDAPSTFTLERRSKTHSWVNEGWLHHVISVFHRGTQLISVLVSRAGCGPTVPLQPGSRPLPEAWASVNSTSKGLRRPPWRFCYSGNTKEVRLCQNTKIICRYFMDVLLTTLQLFPYVAQHSHVFHFSQRVYTMVRRTLMETCGTPFWAKSWNASCALVLMASRTANASHVPASTLANILWNQPESAARLVQVVKQYMQHNELFIQIWCWWTVNIIRSTSLPIVLPRG